MPFDRAKKFKSHGVLDPPPPTLIWRMPKQELLTHFATRTGRLQVRPLVRSVLWQLHAEITAGRAPPVRGNLGSLVYRYIRPPVLRGNPAAAPDPYECTSDAMRDMVLDWKLFRYRDFDIMDEFWEARRIGTTRPHIIVFAEDVALVRFLREVHEKHGVTTTAFGGAVKAITSEYTAAHVADAMAAQHLPPDHPVHLIGLVDYDPSGDIIADSFRTHLTLLGLNAQKPLKTIHPRHFTQHQLGLYKVPVPNAHRKVVAKWLARTGGVAGDPYKLDVTAMPRAALHARIAELITTILRP